MPIRLWTLATITAAIVVSSEITGNARPNSRSTEVVEAAIESIERMDMQRFGQLLASNARFDNMFPLPNRARTFQGRNLIVANIKDISANFERIDFVDERLYVAQDGRTVFVEARGNFAVRGTGAPYQNTYVFAFEIDNGQITAIREYNNPLIIAQTFNFQLSLPAENNSR